MPPIKFDTGDLDDGGRLLKRMADSSWTLDITRLNDERTLYKTEKRHTQEDTRSVHPDVEAVAI